MVEPKGKKVLVAEDDTFLLKVYETKLTKAGYTVITALDGDETLAKIKETSPDLILLDLIMPKKSGFEVLETMKAEGTIQNIPIIVLSNLGQESDTKKALELGATDYFVKSNSSIEDIITSVDRVFKD